MAAASAFVWVPETAIRAETREFLLVRFPDYFEHHLVLAAFRPEREPGRSSTRYSPGHGSSRSPSWCGG